jgi:hypothetical protein
MIITDTKQAYNAQNSTTLNRYKNAMMNCMKLYMPSADTRAISDAIDYSISKRLHNVNAKVVNSYKNKTVNESLLKISDYIADREPIVTAFGTMFMRHGTVPNPLATVVQSFLDRRSYHKKQMFQFPRGSEQFEKFNLLQQLDKIDTNG